MIAYHKTTEEEKYIISEWKYSEEYAIYNHISYEEQKKIGSGFANPQNNFYSFYEKEQLIGFINLREKDNSVFMGIGVNPDYCNKGYGQRMPHSSHGLGKHRSQRALLWRNASQYGSFLTR